MLGVVVRQKKDSVRVTVEKDEDYEDFEFASSELMIAPEDSRITYDNLTSVGELKEPVVLHNLRCVCFWNVGRKFLMGVGCVLLFVVFEWNSGCVVLTKSLERDIEAKRFIPISVPFFLL